MHQNNRHFNLCSIYLRSIRLSGYMVMVNSEITNATIKSLVKHCKKLAILDFEQLSLRLDFEPLNRLIEQRVYACEITELGFSACRNLSDGLLQLICVNCINLKNLDLSGEIIHNLNYGLVNFYFGGIISSCT